MSAIATAILLLLNSLSFIIVPTAFAQKKNVAAKSTAQTAAAPAPSTPINTLPTTITQNFNTLPSSGSVTWTNDTTIPGWYTARTGTGTTIVADTGGNNAGNLYSYGSAASSDRALGSVGSGNAAAGNFFWGTLLTNSSGSTITSLAVSYTGEQWRAGAGTHTDTVAFSYLIGASLTGSLANFQAAGTNVTQLDFTSPITAGGASGAALDGNAAANRTAISFTIPVSIPDGQSILLRWSDPDHAGSDHGMSIDDFSVTANSTPATPTPTPTPSLSINDVSQAEGDSGQTAFTFTVSLSTPAQAGGVTFDYSTANGTATTADNDYTAVPTTGGSIAQGNSSTTVTVQVNGDVTTEPNETFFVNISNVVGAGVTDGQGLGTINNDDVTLTGICAIQGSGSTSPVVGQSVTTRGIVTGTKAGSSGGYYIQDNACDADPNTSNGIFVFTGATLPASAVVGNRVQVSGTIQEFIPSADPNQKPLTEFTSGSTVSTLSTGNTLPTPATISAAETQVNNLDNLEKYEGMRVQVPSLTVVGPTQGSITEPSATVFSTGIFFGVVTGVARPFREAGIPGSDPLPAGAPGTVPRFDENPERIRVDSDAQPGTTALDVNAGTVITNLIGEVDYSFRAYTILPEPANPPTVGVQPGSVPVPTPTANELTVASFNMERFFDTVNDPGSEPVLSASAYNRRLAKASLIVRTVERYPDVIGVEEMEHLTTLQDVASQINSDAVTIDGLPNPQYVAFLKEGNDIGGIDVGFLVKTSRVTVVGGDVTQIELPGCDHVTPSTCYSYTNPNDGTLDILNDRPPLVLQATAPRPGGGTFAFTVIVNHLRSLNNIDDNTTDGTGTVGGRVREKRRKQAEFLANYIQSRQTADPTERIITVGDMNAFRVNDGYVDVIGTILGTPAPANQVTLASADLVNPDQTDLVDTLTATQQYSYNFDGNAQTLDHIIVNPNAQASITRFAYARNDSDFAVKNYESTNELRISDHDQPVAYFNLVPPVCTNVALSSYGATATASSQINSDFPASGVIDGEHDGANWGTGGGWNDGTSGDFPDNVEINFGVAQSIGEIDVYTLQDDFTNHPPVTDSTTFNNYGIRDFQVQSWNGSNWVTVAGGNIIGSNHVKTKLTFGSPITTDRIRVLVSDSADHAYSRVVEVEAYSCSPAVVPSPTPTPTPTPSPTPCGTNVAAASFGGTVTASSQYSSDYPASSLINGDRKGLNWGAGGGWNDDTFGAYPDFVVLTLGGSQVTNQSIDEVDVYSLQDNYGSPVEPTDTMTFNNYGITDFQVQVPNGVGGWVDVAGGHVTGNNLVKRRVVLASPVSTSQIRIQINASADGGYSRLVEVEALSCSPVVATPTPTPTPSPTPCGTNVAASSYGAAITASSEISPDFPASSVINGDRKGLNWEAGGGWNDATANSFPDSVVIDLGVSQPVSEVDVYTLQDNYSSPVEPTDTMTFNNYGITDFQVQVPNGVGGWVDVAGGHVTGNNLVKRRVVLASPVTTNQIRILVNDSADHAFSRLVEVEALSCNPAPIACVNNGGTGGCSSTIQAAVNAASPGDTIKIAPGTYPELVTVNKSVKLRGAQSSVDARTSRTGLPATESVVTGSNGTTSFYVTASDVTIDGFTVQDATIDNQFGAAIVLAGGTSGAHILNNIIQNSIAGLFLANSLATDQAVIQRNRFRNNTLSGSASGHGIYADQSVSGGVVRNVLIDSNDFVIDNGSSPSWGIGISNTDTANPYTNLSVQNNKFTSTSPLSRGMYFYGTHSSSIVGNVVTNKTNYAIGFFGGDDEITVQCNAIQFNTGRGIYVSDDLAVPNTNITINYNNINGNAVAGLTVDSGSYTGSLDAENNWWGNATGPTIASNPSGTGDIIDDTGGVVDYTPFLTSGATCTNLIASPANKQGWLEQITASGGLVQFVSGPPVPPRGIGSLRLFTGTQGDESAAFRNSNYNGTPLSSLSSMGYCTNVTQWNGSQTPYLILNVDRDNNGTVDDILFFEPEYSRGGVYNPAIPAQPAPALNTWQCWKALRGGWYGLDANTFNPSFGGPGASVLPFSDYTTAYPAAVLRNTASGAVRLVSGFASPGDVFDSKNDTFKIGVGSNLTTYDFEPVP